MKKILESLDDVTELGHEFVDCKRYYGVPDSVILTLSSGSPEIVEHLGRQWIAIGIKSKNSEFRKVIEHDGEWTREKTVWHEEPITESEMNEVRKAVDKLREDSSKTYLNTEIVFLESKTTPKVLIRFTTGPIQTTVE